MSPCELSHLIDRVQIGTLLGMEMVMQRIAQGSVPALLPIMGAVFISFLIIGLAMPVLPLHVHQGLGLGTFVVGLVAGSQFAAALVSRMWAGRHADTRGAKQAVIAGLFASAAAGLLYLLSLSFVSKPAISVTILLLGRAVLGAGESFIITGAQTWGLALAGAQNTGKVLAWMGTAVRRVRARRTGWHDPVRRLRLYRDCDRDDGAALRHTYAGLAASPRRADSARPP